MGVDTEVTVPMQPLLDWWRAHNSAHKQSGCSCGRGGVCGSNESLARRLKISHSTLHRRLQARKVTMAESDRWARILGVHPGSIWRGWDRAPMQAALRTPRRPPFGN